MMPLSGRAAALLLAVLAVPAAADHGIGTDLGSLNFCLYGDCEARGSYVADPAGAYNPATLAVLAALYLPRGFVASGSYYAVDIGAVETQIGVGVATATWLPFALQAAAVYADADGGVRPLPGVEMTFRTRAVRLSVAMDAEETLGISGLSLGLAGVVPGTTSDLRLQMQGFTFVQSEERRELELVPGIHWRGGEQEWFMAGAYLDVLRNYVESTGLDPISGAMLHRHATNNIWFARAGVSLLPLVPLGFADGTSPRAEWSRWLRVGVDVEYYNLAVPDEEFTQGAIAYFGVDGPLVPDAWNPLAAWVRPWILGGVDTRGGWGVGAGLYGQGPLRFLGCNQAWASRPLTAFLGERVETLAVTCSAMVPF
jgi:hypothetical protein